jgi:hypothetical protein
VISAAEQGRRSRGLIVAPGSAPIKPEPTHESPFL